MLLMLDGNPCKVTKVEIKNKTLKLNDYSTDECQVLTIYGIHILTKQPIEKPYCFMYKEQIYNAKDLNAK